METKVNYTLVGLFVLCLGAAGIMIPLWLSLGLNQQKYNTYVVYMKEAVDGLSVNATVKYNGVDVGYVRSVELNPKETQQVCLLLNIKKGTPITTNTTAVLQSQGVTGVEYIGLNGGAMQNAKNLAVEPGQTYPEIKVSPSIKFRLDQSVTALLYNLNKISNQIDFFINAKNGQLLNQTLQHMNQLSLGLTKNSMHFDQTLQLVNAQLQNMGQSTEAVPEVLTQTQAILQNLQMITNEVKKNPSVLLRGNMPPSLGPGEEKE